MRTASPQTLKKLEWPRLTSHLAEWATTEEGKDLCHELKPNLKRDEIEERWAEVGPLQELANLGYSIPIGDVPRLTKVLRSIELGQILDTEEFIGVLDLLNSVRRLSDFCGDFGAKCSTRRKAQTKLYPLPQIANQIERSIDPEGGVKDDASKELSVIRGQIRNLRGKIEQKIGSLLHDQEIEQYLQDEFFTVRSERYVIPMRLDGRGRLKGNILDTSASGQTLYLEPEAIAEMNAKLQDLYISEKLEVMRIIRELSAKIASEYEIITDNYRELIRLDFYFAQAKLASILEAEAIQISDEPKVSLRSAKHPLLVLNKDVDEVANDIELGAAKVLIISGPNAGGKTVVLKTVGLLQLMMHAGLLIPADKNSEFFLYDQIFIEMGDSQSLESNLSTFSGHLIGLKPIVEKASAKDLVLLDELAVGTEPTTGSAIAQAILEHLETREASVISTTHFDGLKMIALANKRFRNGCMEYSIENFSPTYKLILDVPGQSYGLEMAQKFGLLSIIIQRARDIKGGEVSELDDAVSELMRARDEANKRTSELESEVMRVRAEKARWEAEVDELKASRQKAADKLASRYDEDMKKMRQNFEDAISEMRQLYKNAQKGLTGEELRDELLGVRKKAQDQLSALEKQIRGIEEDHKVEEELPGKPAVLKALRVGMEVYVVPLKSTGKIIKLSDSESEPVSIEAGIVRTRVKLKDLRITGTKKTSSIPKPHRAKTPNKTTTKRTSELVIQTTRNSVDLRGKEVDRAIESMWRFVDSAVLRGEPDLVIIHGHGTDRVKNAIRDELQNSPPYDLAFRPGNEKEGGDGVTIIFLQG